MGNGTLADWLDKLGLHLPSGEGKRPMRLGFDWMLLLLTIGLVIFGLVMVYSASADFSYTNYGSETYVVQRQVLLAMLGFGLLVVAAMVPYQLLKKVAFLALVVTVFVLLLLAFFGETRLGAIRAISSGSMQPSELAKLVVIIYMAAWLASHKEHINSLQFGIVPLGVALGVVFALIYIQPDLSAALTIAILGAILWFLGGGGWKQVGIVALIGVVAGFIVIMAVPEGKARFNNFWFGWSDLLMTSDHVQKALMGFMRGGLFGVGIGKGEIKLLGLPFPQTDSIFAVVGEETGLFGSLLLLLAYLGILWRGSAIALKAPDSMGRLLAGGLTFWILFEATLNMMVLLGVLPFAGQALPFISAGGSNLLVSLASIGIMLNISRQSVKVEEREEQSFDAVVDLRRRDWRRRVPRTVHPASPSVRR